MSVFFNSEEAESYFDVTSGLGFRLLTKDIPPDALGSNCGEFHSVVKLQGTARTRCSNDRFSPFITVPDHVRFHPNRLASEKGLDPPKASEPGIYPWWEKGSEWGGCFLIDSASLFHTLHTSLRQSHPHHQLKILTSKAIKLPQYPRTKTVTLDDLRVQPELFWPTEKSVELYGRRLHYGDRVAALTKGQAAIVQGLLERKDWSLPYQAQPFSTDNDEDSIIRTIQRLNERVKKQGGPQKIIHYDTFGCQLISP